MTQTAENSPSATARELPTAGLLQRVILPRIGDPMSVRSLYLDERTGLRLTTTTALPTDLPVKAVHLTGSTVGGTRRLHATSRTTAVVDADSEISFGAYFNAFPASYWRRWTVLDKVRLRLDLTGGGRVDVYRTKADGSQIFERGEQLNGPGRHQVDIELDLRPFEDGGWYWFDLTTDSGDLTAARRRLVRRGRAGGPRPGAVGMPTFNRPADAVATLTALASEQLCSTRSSPSIVADQGTQKVRDAGRVRAGRRAAGREAEARGAAQPGWFRRLRALDARGARHRLQQILYMDDDILLEPDSVLRALAFSRFTRSTDARRRADAVAAVARAAVHDGRGRRPQRLPVAQRSRHRAAPRLRRTHPAPDPVAAPPRRRRLQRAGGCA